MRVVPLFLPLAHAEAEKENQGMCVLVYQNLEGLRWQDARFWIINPHAIEYCTACDATKFFSIFVYFGVFAFQIWVAERLLITVFNRQSVEAWRTMVNDITAHRAPNTAILQQVPWASPRKLQ